MPDAFRRNGVHYVQHYMMLTPDMKEGLSHHIRREELYEYVGERQADDPEAMGHIFQTLDTAGLADA